MSTQSKLRLYYEYFKKMNFKKENVSLFLFIQFKIYKYNCN